MGNSNPAITTIIPTYRRPGSLQKAIQSVLDQTYSHLTIHVCDNASGDETETVVHEFAGNHPDIVYHRHSHNMGAVKNFIFGMEQVDTPFFSILSDDDYLLPHFYETAIREFDRHPDCGFVALGCLVSDGRKIIRKPLINHNTTGYYKPPDSFNVMLKKWMTLTWTSILFRKEVIERLGTLLDFPCLPNDIEYLLRIGAQYPISILPETGAVFTDNLAGHSSVTALSWIWPCYLEVIDRITGYTTLLPEQKTEARNVLLGRLKKRLIYSSLSYISRQDHKMADEARKPLTDFYNDRIASGILGGLIHINRLFPRITGLPVNLLIRKKHALIYLFESLQARSTRWRRKTDKK